MDAFLIMIHASNLRQPRRSSLAGVPQKLRLGEHASRWDSTLENQMNGARQKASKTKLNLIKGMLT